MAAIFQLRRGTTGGKPTLTAGELYVDQTSENLIVGVNGSKEITLLKLNDINTGSLHLTGDITLSGSIYLGNATADNISALGVFTTNLVPNPTNTIDLGTTSAKWRNVYATNISGAIAATNGVVSGSSQITSILDSLNSFSGSQLTQNTALATISGSLILTASANTISVTNLNSFSSSQLTQNTILGGVTASLETRATTIQTLTASYNSQLSAIGNETASLETRATTIQTLTASYNSRLTEIGVVSGSLIASASATSQSLWYLYSSSTNHEERIDYIEGIGGISGGSPLGPLNIFSASINTFTASIAGTNTFTTSTNSRLNSIEAATSSYETNGRGIVSGSSQLASAFEVIASSTHTLLSGSSQILGGTDIHSGSYTGNNGIVSGSSQINADSITNFDSNVKDKLNTDGVVSGSSQLSSAFELIASSTHTLVSGSSQVTLSSTTGGSTSSHVQFHCIGLGTAASGVVGEVRATGDITAFYSSDIRLKENIQPIQNALEKVESISGNTYDWKEGYEEIHSHKGNDVGVIAQEIEEILPQIVTNRDNGYKAVQYEKIIPLLIEAIKELSAKIKRLENK